MTIYFPNGSYGPICDIIPETTPAPVIVEVELDDPTEVLSTTQEQSIVKLPTPALCKTVTLTTKYSPSGPYGPVCDIVGSDAGGDGGNYNCPSPVGKPATIIPCPPPDEGFLKAIGNPPTGDLHCITLQDGQLYCFDPKLNGCTAADYEDILDDMSVLASRCAGLTNIGKKPPNPIPATLFPQLICGSIQRMSSQGVYEHTTPTDITYMNLIMIGAGGGSGGGDDQRYSNPGRHAQQAGRGNNSGGAGSIIRLTLTLDPSRPNKITSVVGGPGAAGLHYTNKRTKAKIPFNGGGLGGFPGPRGKSGGGGQGGGASALYVNGQLVAQVGGGGGGGGAGCLAFLDGSNWYHKNVLCYASGGKGGADDFPIGPEGRVLVGVGSRGGTGADDDPAAGKYGGGAGGRGFNGQNRNAATQNNKGGGGGHGVTIDGTALTNGGTTSSSSGAAGGAFGGGGGGNAPGGTGGAGGNGAARIKVGSTITDYLTPGTYSYTVPANVSMLTEVVCISAGGSGHKDANGDDEGGGGGGGAYAFDLDVPVTPGAVLTIVVGAGGATRSTQGSNRGGDTYIKSNNDNDGYDPAPWGNWQNHRVEYTGNNVANPIAKDDDDSGREHYGLLKLSIPKFTNPPVFPIDKPHPIWSKWMEENSVWINQGEPNFYGQFADIRLNLNCSQTGTYTFKTMVDDKLGIYMAPWYDTGVTDFVDGGRFYNGEPNTALDESIPNPDSTPASSWPATLPADITGAQAWQKVLAHGFNADQSTPTSTNFTISTAGRKVFRFLIYNISTAGSEWGSNPAGMGIEIFRPDGKKIWDTGSQFQGLGGGDAQIGDGPGGGGGGSPRGRGGGNPADLAVPMGACIESDSSALGGSAGKTYILDSPAVQVTYFNQGPPGFHSGWTRPGTGDASFRNGYGGYGGGKPTNFSIIFNGIEYPLYNSSRSQYDVLIPGMGNGVWNDNMNGKVFAFHYAFGLYGGNPTGSLSLQRLSRGSYEPATNTTLRSTAPYPWYRPRSIELALQWNPIKVGSSWNTKVRLRGIPGWAQGSAWDVGDIVTATFPPTKDQGNQPWIDLKGGHGFDQWATGVRRPFVYDSTGPSTSGQNFFTFQIKITEVDGGPSRIFPGSPGDHGHIRYQYGYALAGATPGEVPGNYTTQETSQTNTYAAADANADDPGSDDNQGT